MASENALGFLLLAAGAVLLLQPAANASESDAASTGVTDLLSTAQGDLMNITTMGASVGDPNSNRKAFLDMIAMSEIGADLLAASNNGYDVVVGGGRFGDYSTHPRIYVAQFNSTAAGRYQINWPTFQTLSRQTGLTDFSPATQDAMALQLCANKGALADIDAGNISSAIVKCAPVWASLPGYTYGQHANTTQNLLAWYAQAGGAVLA